MTRCALGLLLIGLTVPTVLADKRPIAVTDLFAFQRVADPQISPDGKYVVYQVGSVDLGANKSTTNLWLADTARGRRRGGSRRRRRLTGIRGGRRTGRRSCSSPPGPARTSSGSSIWAGARPELTTISTGPRLGLVADGKTVAFVSAVFPEYSDKPFKESDAANKKRLEEAEKGPVKARVLPDSSSVTGTSTSRTAANTCSSFRPTAANRKDVTPGDGREPTSSTFSVGDDFTFSPDGKHLIFTAVPTGTRPEYRLRLSAGSWSPAANSSRSPSE